MITLYNPGDLKIVHVTSVDFIKRPHKKPVHIVQYDKTIPIMKVKLYSNDIEYALPEDMDVRVRWGKEDNTFVYKDILGCDDERTSIYFEIDEQMSYYAGIVYPIIELKFIADDQEHRAGSAQIPVVIDPNPILDSDVESQSQYFDTLYILTKAKIEAELTGEIDTHTHASDNTWRGIVDDLTSFKRINRYD